MDAFLMLEMHLQSMDDGKRQLIFLDELPWLDTPRSGFITALKASGIPEPVQERILC